MMKKLDNENIIKRVYTSIKERVITCSFPPGDRLNIEQLAELLRVSPTPVRESLNRLVAEELIVMVPRMGFFMKSLVESEIRDLYEVNQVLLDWSVCAVRKGHLKGGDVGFPEMSLIMEKLIEPQRLSAHCVVRYSGELFSHLASHSGNSEVDLRVRNINDRLHYVRLCECEMMDNPAEMIAPLYQMYDGVCYEDLRHGLRSYHEDRLSLLRNVLKARRYSVQAVGEEYGA